MAHIGFCSFDLISREPKRQMKNGFVTSEVTSQSGATVFTHIDLVRVERILQRKRTGLLPGANRPGTKSVLAFEVLLGITEVG